MFQSVYIVLGEDESVKDKEIGNVEKTRFARFKDTVSTELKEDWRILRFILVS